MNFLSQLVQQSNLYLLTIVQGSEGWHGAEGVFSYFVTELKFMCPTHSEAKQTETSVLGAEGGLLQVKQREWRRAKGSGGVCSHTRELLVVLSGEKLL